MTQHTGISTSKAAPVSDDDRLTYHHRLMLAARDHLRQAAELTGDQNVKRMALALREYLGSGLFNEDEHSILGDEIETVSGRLVDWCRIGADRARTP